MRNNLVHYFKYKYNEGPLSLEELSKATFTIGNCRRAIQDYLYTVHGLFLKPEQILLPEGYISTGIFITKNGVFDISLYKPGDIIYAERFKDKNNKSIYKERKYFKTEDKWIIALHSAVFVDLNTVYHATAITGETCMWDFAKFNKYYRIVAVKRVLKD